MNIPVTTPELLSAADTELSQITKIADNALYQEIENLHEIHIDLIRWATEARTTLEDLEHKL